MTCEELHWYFEDHLRDAEGRSDRAVVAEHIAACVDCSRFVEGQRELGRDFRMVRDSAGPVPEGVDACVLVNYRRYLADQKTMQRATFGVPAMVLRWSAVAASVLIAAAALLFFAYRPVTNRAQMTAPSIERLPIAEAAAKAPAVVAAQHAKRKLAGVERVRPTASEKRSSISSRQMARALPDGFRSLMYCDELSCSGDMDMIRVQLPSSAMPRQVSGFIQPVRSVTADVLLGPDGIARGIRFEEIEF